MNSATTPLLVCISGLPGVGKTTVSRLLAQTLPAAYLRIDAIEAGLAASVLAIRPAEDAGYEAAYRLAAENLALGLNVVADAVNPIALTRHAWADIARAEAARFLAVELTCAPDVHRARVEGRKRGPRWPEVARRSYEPWPEALRIDTTTLAPMAVGARVLAACERA